MFTKLRDNVVFKQRSLYAPFKYILSLFVLCAWELHLDRLLKLRLKQ